MRKFFSNLGKDDRGDQVVGWAMLAALVALVAGFLWTPEGVNIGDDLNLIMGGVENATQVDSPRF